MTTAAKSPTTALKWQKRYFTAPAPGNGLHGLLVRVKRAFRTWSLKREGRMTMESFLRMAGEMGFHPNSQMHPPSQIAKLSRANQIATELRALRFEHLNSSSK